LASIPLLFGVQQFCEGLVWIGIDHDDGDMTRLASLFFLFFAICFWLFWIPFSAMFLEKCKTMRCVFAIVAILGFASGAAAYYPVLVRPDVLVTSVANHSIRYDITRSPTFESVPQGLWHLAYLSVVGFPLFLSSEKRLLGFNIALVLSAVLSHAYFWYAFDSMWCYFAAILSLYLAFLFFKVPRPGILPGKTSASLSIPT